MSPKAAGEPNDSLSEDFLDFIMCLDEAGVDAVLVGGYALAVHGVVRATGDIDFLYRRAPKNVRRLCVAMREFGAPENVIDFDALMTPDTVTMFGAVPHRIDLLSGITGVTFSRVWSGSVEADIQGQLVRVIGATELRANKRATGRRKDASDLRALERVELAATPAPGARARQAAEKPRRPR